MGRFSVPSPYSILKIPIILLPIQTLLLHLHHSTCSKLMKKNISKLRRISTRDRYIGISTNLRKRQETCHHRAIHPLHDDDDNLSLSHSSLYNSPCDSHLLRMFYVKVLVSALYFSLRRCALLSILFCLM